MRGRPYDEMFDPEGGPRAHCRHYCDWLHEQPPERLAHLYLCRGLSTYRIAELTGLDRQRVTRMLHRAGVAIRPRGAGRLRPVRRRGDPAGLAQLMAGLYEVCGLSSRQIADITDLPERTVRDRLHRYGVRARSRGGWNREDRRTVPAETLRDLYERLGLTADEVGALIGASRQTVLRSAHALGIPVRIGGAVPLSGPEEIELVSALYEDDLIASVLETHDIPSILPGGPVWARFPEPIPLSAPLVKDLYWFCGVGLSHIELLTGQPAMTVRGFMRREGIPLRPPGGRTPFLRRWRTGRAPSARSRRTLRNLPGRANGAAGAASAFAGRPRPGTLVFCCQRGQHPRVAQFGRPGQQVGGQQAHTRNSPRRADLTSAWRPVRASSRRSSFPRLTRPAPPRAAPGQDSPDREPDGPPPGLSVDRAAARAGDNGRPDRGRAGPQRGR